MVSRCIVRRCPIRILLTVLVALITKSLSFGTFLSDGVTFEYCRTDKDCAKERRCMFVDSQGAIQDCSETSKACFCRGQEYTECVSSAGCPYGERCFRQQLDSEHASVGFCWTCRVQVSENISYVDSNPATCQEVWLGGYTGDVCHIHNKKCASDRSCVQFEFDEGGATEQCPMGRKPCYCWPPELKKCSSSGECEDRERCVKTAFGAQACFSCGRVDMDNSLVPVDSRVGCAVPKLKQDVQTVLDKAHVASWLDSKVVKDRPSTASGLELKSVGDKSAASSEPEVYPTDGASLEYCRTNENCAGSRACFYTPGDAIFKECNSTTSGCFCRYDNRIECATSSDCPNGERCYIQSDGDGHVEGNFCWTCRYGESSLLTPIDSNASTCRNIWLGKYTGDICYFNYPECVSGRSCIEFLDDGSADRCSSQFNPCFCWPSSLTRCTSSTACDDGERCATNEEGVTACFSCGRVEADPRFIAQDNNAVCATPTYTPSPSSTPASIPSPTSTSATPSTSVAPSSYSTTPALTPSPNLIGSPSKSPPAVLVISSPPAPPCISVAHLSGIDGSDLVYRTHIRASVLCDMAGSCATPGHVVVFRQRLMMMRTYCANHSVCSKRSAWVNSPRMRRSVRVPSQTEDLMFTAFSARYESNFEELVLRLLVLFGA